MRRGIIALGTALIVAFTPLAALADSGSFTSDDGPTCSWTGSSGSGYVDIDCSGYSRRAGGYVRYSCTYYFYGGGSADWSCRDSDGNTWRGSR